MRRVEGAGDLYRDLERTGDRQHSGAQACFEGFAFQVLHHQESQRTLAANVIKRTDVRVIQAGDRRALRAGTVP